MVIAAITGVVDHPCIKHVSAEMTLRYASLASPTVRAAYEQAMTKVRNRQPLPLVIAGKPTVPDRVEWLRGELLKTRVAHGYCSRHLTGNIGDRPWGFPRSAASRTCR